MSLDTLTALAQILVLLATAANLIVLMLIVQRF